MFEKLKKFFRGTPQSLASLRTDKDGAPSDHDLHLATLVLLVEVAASDREIPHQEAEVVCGLMQDQFGLDDALIPPLLETAVAIRKEKGKLDEFVKCLNEHFDVEQRKKILAMVWRVVLADGRVEKLEKRVATQLQFRLELDEDSADEARQMAEHRKV